ncbi:MAG: chemotaxis protein CheA [Hahellaceae bacterium]|nr:chemotaxis protein CheA [Hahellaceae bacterium]
MSLDLSQFHAVFFEESFEAVTAIESGLLDIQIDNVDPEMINTIFRAAHSIKGGSATFGFQQVASYTHVMENLLDEVRDGKRAMSQEIVDVLLQSVDALRELLTLAQAGDQMEDGQFAEYKQALDDLMKGKAQGKPKKAAAKKTDTKKAEKASEPVKDIAAEAAVAADSGAASELPDGWRIVLNPHKEMMQRGNDPLRLIRELGTLGKTTVTCDTSLVPDWEHFEPLNSSLSWTVILEGQVAREAVDEVFSWVEDECDLAFIPLTGADLKAKAPQPDDSSEVVVKAEKPAAVEEAVAETESNSPSAASSAAARPKASPPAAAESQSIRVDLHKVDSLINMVGELVITQSMLNVLSDDEMLQGMEKLQQGLGQLQRQTRALQEGVMQIRMLPISFCFNRFPRMVRDLSRQLEKEIELILTGESTEVDKTVIEKINDPLVHLVRNSVDHGIEVMADRVKAGKPEHGSVWLRAYHQVGNIVIEVEDDGKGLDPDLLFAKAVKKGLIAENAQLNQAQIFDLIFAPGFSTKDQATDLSGRGVGMDVVKRNVQALGGGITVDSELGRGTRFTIRLPLTLAIMDGQLAKVGEEIYVVPLVSIIESLQPEASMINVMAGAQETIKLRGQYLPVLRLADAFGVPLSEDERSKPLTEGIVVIVEHEHQRFGIFLDDLLSQQQIVIKSLDENYHTVEGISAATILGDGRVALILDVASLCQLQQKTEAFADAG